MIIEAEKRENIFEIFSCQATFHPKISIFTLINL